MFHEQAGIVNSRATFWWASPRASSIGIRAPASWNLPRRLPAAAARVLLNPPIEGHCARVASTPRVLEAATNHDVPSRYVGRAHRSPGSVDSNQLSNDSKSGIPLGPGRSRPIEPPDRLGEKFAGAQPRPRRGSGGGAFSQRRAAAPADSGPAARSNRLGDRRRRVRSAPSASRSGVDLRPTRPVPRTQRRLLLQAVGRLLPDEPQPRARGAGVERAPGPRARSPVSIEALLDDVLRQRLGRGEEEVVDDRAPRTLNRQQLGIACQLG